MTKLSKLLESLFFSLVLSSCATYTVSDWQTSITLPASQDCYSFNVVSGKETRLAAHNPLCISKKAHSVWIDSESYKMLRSDIQKNCQFQQCTQLTGAFDQLFLMLDKGLQKIPVP